MYPKFIDKDKKKVKSTPKGVTEEKNRYLKKYKAIIRVNKILLHLGYFYSKEEAEKAFLKAKQMREAGSTVDEIRSAFQQSSKESPKE